MTISKMHREEVNTDASVVRQLLAAQFPEWADLPLTSVDSAGTDNTIYLHTNPVGVGIARRTIEAIVAEHRASVD